MGGAHNHPIDGGSIPSWADINWLLSCENNNFPSNNGTAFNIAVVADPQNPGQTITYALTIADIAIMQAQINADMDIPKVLERPTMELKTEYFLTKQAKAFNNVNGNTAELEKKFLQYFNNYGVNLSKLNPATNKWETLALTTPVDPKRPNLPNSLAPPVPCN